MTVQWNDRPADHDGTLGVQYQAPPPDAVREAMLVVIQQVCFQGDEDEEPTGDEVRSTSLLRTNDQPYRRTVRVSAGQGWVPLDVGWIQRPGLVLIHHRTERAAVNPSAAEESAREKRRVEFAVLQTGSAPDAATTTPLFYLPPREGLPLRLAEGQSLFFRCTEGVARCSVAVFPDTEELWPATS